MSGAIAAADATLSDYERERLLNIQRNQEMMASLGVAHAKEQVNLITSSPSYVPVNACCLCFAGEAVKGLGWEIACFIHGTICIKHMLLQMRHADDAVHMLQ